MKTKIILLAIVIAAFILSFYISYGLSNKPKVTIKKNIIPVPQEFILNPYLQKLSANIEGKLIEKGKDYFVLESNNNKVKLFMEPRGLTFFALLSNPNEEVEYEDIKIGDSLKGGVSIIVSEENAIGMSAKRNRGDIIAHYFIVQNR